MVACATDVGGGAPGAGGSQGGTAGATGVAGASGAAGTNATAGTTGTPGSGGSATGTAGAGTGGSTSTAGTGGTAGTTGGGGRGGTTGTAGTAGSAGSAGAAGATGIAGRGGATGSSGTTGTGGRGGTTGTAGAQGSAGASGTAGTTGTGGAGAGPVNLNGRKALLVVDNPSSLDDGEIILQMTLANRGMIVTVGASTGPATLASGQNLVLVSSSAGSGDFVPVYKDVAVPMIVFGNSAYSNLGWIASSSGKGSVSSTTLCSLADTNAALQSDVMAGVGFKMILDSRSTSLYWGTPTASAIKTASVMGQATQLVTFAYPKGAALATGTAADKRVGFGVKVDSVQDLTVEGFKLLMAAIEWTAGP